MSTGRTKINRDFIKGGHGGESPFYEVISQKIYYFTKDAFPKVHNVEIIF